MFYNFNPQPENLKALADLLDAELGKIIQDGHDSLGVSAQEIYDQSEARLSKRYKRRKPDPRERPPYLDIMTQEMHPFLQPKLGEFHKGHFLLALRALQRHPDTPGFLELSPVPPGTDFNEAAQQEHGEIKVAQSDISHALTLHYTGKGARNLTQDASAFTKTA